MTTETAGPVERWAIEHGVSVPQADNQNSTVQVMLDCVMLNSLIDFARQHDKRTVVLVQALDRAAEANLLMKQKSERSLKPSPQPHWARFTKQMKIKK